MLKTPENFYRTQIQVFSEALKKCVVTNQSREQIQFEDTLNEITNLFSLVRQTKNSIAVIGNGGSAAVASHAKIDLINVGKIRTLSLHESSVITCMANDYGYEQSFAQQIPILLSIGDVLIAISSSGCSKNICNAVDIAVKLGIKIVTFSGFSHENPLRFKGSYNFWLNASDYGIVEIGHQFILHNIVDRLRLKFN